MPGDEGQLVFTELKMETHAHTETELLSEAKGQLYPVKVSMICLLCGYDLMRMW